MWCKTEKVGITMDIFDSVVLCLVLAVLLYHSTHCGKCHYGNTRCKLCNYAKRHSDETKKVLEYFDKQEKRD